MSVVEQYQVAGPTHAEMVERARASRLRIEAAGLAFRSQQEEERRAKKAAAAALREREREATEREREAAKAQVEKAFAKYKVDLEALKRKETKAQMADRLIAETAAEYSISEAELLSERRFKREVAARHTAIYRIMLATGWSLPQIGRCLGHRDHTTILNAIKRYKAGLVPPAHEFPKVDTSPIKKRVRRDRTYSVTIWTDEKMSLVEAMSLDGKEFTEIGAAFGVSDHAVAQALSRLRRRRAKIEFLRKRTKQEVAVA